MRHRAPRRPLTTFLRRLPRRTARLIGASAGLGPVRALVAITAVVCLGGVAYAALAPETRGSSDDEAGSVGIDPLVGGPEAADSEVPSSTLDATPSEDGTPSGSSPETETPSVDQSKAPPPTTDAPTSTPPDQVPDSSSNGTGTPSPSPKEPSVTASTTRGDSTPPDTSLSAEFPDKDVARFTFSATEAASFSCSLDGAAFTDCDSSQTYVDLHPGWHTIAVRATDEAGNVDPSAAEHRWHTEQGGSNDEE